MFLLTNTEMKADDTKHSHAGVRFLAQEITREAEIRDADMTVLIQKNVRWLHKHMQILHNNNNNKHICIAP